ncbi:MAG: hypothetical protein M3Z04_25310 [Chloroflexota bacterium]|nr:hypothetical protein [Chloroflexota bacterium]
MTAAAGSLVVLWRIVACQAQVAHAQVDARAAVVTAAAPRQIAASAASLPPDDRCAAFLALPLVRAVHDL